MYILPHMGTGMEIAWIGWIVLGSRSKLYGIKYPHGWLVDPDQKVLWGVNLFCKMPIFTYAKQENIKGERVGVDEIQRQSGEERRIYSY